MTGRFGREIRRMPDAGERDAVRALGGDERFEVEYEVDPHAVAEAILARLAAGGLVLEAPPRDGA